MINPILGIKHLNITEIFKSIQGETSLTGIPTTFIRLAACNLRCTWCDTPYSFGKGVSMPLHKIIHQTEQNRCMHVCLTGGEPLLQQNVHALIKELCDKNFKLSLETGGSLPIDLVDPRVAVILDVKCPGSEMSDRNLWSNLAKLKDHDEVKFVILDKNDYDYAVQICTQYQLFKGSITVLFSLYSDKWILRIWSVGFLRIIFLCA